jgi:phosphoribosylanthranilate isomerase
MPKHPKVKVKICGITNWSDARRAVAGGADFLGFNFYPASPRYITPAKTRRIVNRLPKGVCAVGIFVDAPPEKILAAAEKARLDYVQLHGEESPAAVAQLKKSLPVIKAIRVRAPFRLSQLAPYKGADALLLDGFDPKQVGGSGKTFDWAIARRAGKRYRIFLAGGLTPENVAQAIATATPFAIDVCSGVEAQPGKKNPARMKAFLDAAIPGRRAAESVRTRSHSARSPSTRAAARTKRRPQ